MNCGRLKSWDLGRQIDPMRHVHEGDGDRLRRSRSPETEEPVGVAVDV